MKKEHCRIHLELLDNDEKTQHLQECQDCRIDAAIENALRLTPEKSHALSHRKHAHEIVDLFHRDPKPKMQEQAFRLPLARIAAIIFVAFGLAFWLLNGEQETREFVKIELPPKIPKEKLAVAKHEKAPIKKFIAKQVAGIPTNATEYSEGAHISLGENESLLAINQMNVLLYLQKNTKVVLEKLRKNEVEVRLISGSLFMDVLPNQGMKVKVHTNQGSIKVIGTVFYVEAKNKTRVGVLRGKVNFSTPDRQTQITKDHVFDSDTKRLDIFEKDDRMDIFNLIRKNTTCASSLFSFHIHPENARLKIDGVLVTNAPLFDILLCEGDHNIELEKTGFKKLERRIRVDNTTTHELYLKLKRVEHEVKKSEVLGAQDLLRRARGARIEKNWKKAQKIYLKIIKKFPQERAARIALIALGDLERGPLSRPRKALHHYRAYQKTRGPLIVEAYYGEIMALKKLGRSSEEKEKILKFLTRFPSALQRRRLKKRLGEL